MFAGFAALLISLPTSVVGQETTGLVYRARGAWAKESATTERVVAGAAVSREDEITAPDSAGAELILWLAAGRVECHVIGSLACRSSTGALDCVIDGRVHVGRCVDALMRTPRTGVFDAVAHWFQQQPRRLIPLASRDFGFLADAVVGTSEGRVNLARAFEGVPINRYRLCLARINLMDAAASTCAHRLVVEWSPGSSVTSEGVTPGLYEVRPLPPDGRNAWLLIVDGAEASNVRSALDEARAAAGELGVADLAEKQTFERAYLMYLAAQHGIL